MRAGVYGALFHVVVMYLGVNSGNRPLAMTCSWSLHLAERVARLMGFDAAMAGGIHDETATSIAGGAGTVLAVMAYATAIYFALKWLAPKAKVGADESGA